MNITDVKAFLSQMNNELKEKSPSVFSQKTYTDEPIIRTAAQLKNYEPPQYREMRRISYFAYEKGWSSEHIFYEQAKFMADFDDDYAFSGSFSSYFPTYAAMNPEQQRGYFSWRTKVRQGDIRPVSASFAFVYMYELINLIGVNSAEEAFFKLNAFYKAYLPFAPELEQYVPVWLVDMIAFYDLDASLFAAYCELSFEKKLSVVQNGGGAEPEELFAAINALSSYQITGSPFYKEYPAETQAAVCAAFAAMNEKYGKTHKTTFTENLFGRICAMPYTVFGAAVFFDRTRTPDHETVLCDNFSFSFINGQCMCYRCWGRRGKSTVSAGYLKYTESVLREVFGYEKPLRAESPAKPFIKIARQAAENAYKTYTDKKRAEELKYVDTSLLDSIIISAEKTRDRLLTDEEKQDDVVPETAFVTEKVQETELPEAENSAEKEDIRSLPLTSDELGFVRLLLSGGDAAAYLKQRGLKLSLVCDSVNEKLYDTFFDNIIDFDGEMPVLTEDYAEELAGMIPERQE